MIVVFIGGASSSGKTTFAKKVADKFEKEGSCCYSFSMDDYFKEIPDGVDINYFRKETNFDNPDSYDFDLLEEHLNKLNTGEEIIKPIFDFKTNKRLMYELVTPKDVFIIDGVFALTFAKQLTRAICRITAFVNVDSYLALIKKRVLRDTVERSRTEKAVLQQERKYVGPGFFDIVAKYSTGAHFYVLNKLSEDDSKHFLDSDSDEIFNYYQENYVIQPPQTATL